MGLLLNKNLKAWRMHVTDRRENSKGKYRIMEKKNIYKHKSNTNNKVIWRKRNTKKGVITPVQHLLCY